MHRFRSLMVVMDGMASDAGLVAYAAGIARSGPAESVRFVHVLLNSDENTPEAKRRQVRDAMEAIVKGNFGAMPDAMHRSFDVLTGPRMDRLLECAAVNEIDLMLIGQRRDQPGRRSLARRLAMKAPCSIWVVPEGSPPPAQRIIVPTDFSAHAVDTMKVAIGLAQVFGLGECTVVHVYFDESVARFEGFDRVMRDQAGRDFQKFLAAIDHHGITVSPLLEEGPNVANAILRVAERLQGDLIVMGTRGRSRSAAILLGSVAEETIIASRIPVLAVKHFGAQLGLLQVLLQREFLHRANPHTD